MKKDEFLLYFDICQGQKTVDIINGLSQREISEVRNNCFIAIARIGQEYAKIKNEIDKRFLVLKAQGLSIEPAKKQAEIEVNNKYEVSRRELEWLLEALNQGCNACASRINILESERRGT